MLTTHLNNPFVVDILGSDLTCTAPYIVLEYSELGSLQKYVANRRDWWRIAGWLHDISCGLTIIHERGDFIRDIKPSNLLRFTDANGSELIKIADFGLGQRPDNPSGPMTASPFGTVGYIDPIAQISQTFTPASDIYSLGVTARELLTGNKDLRNPIPGPPEFRALISSMTHFDLNRRPTARQIPQQIGIHPANCCRSNGARLRRKRIVVAPGWSGRHCTCSERKQLGQSLPTIPRFGRPI